MKKYPDWVPEEVIAFHRRLCDAEQPLNPRFDRHDREILGCAIESLNMQKAWQAISRRDKTPILFAKIIMYVTGAAERMDMYSTQDEVIACKKLTKKVTALRTEIENVLGGYGDRTLSVYFEDPPTQTLQDLIDNLERFTKSVEKNRKVLKSYSGKPESTGGKRAFVIRMLSEQVKANYGKPLSHVVAATSSVILDDDIDPDLVKKLVRTYKKIDPVLIMVG